MNPFQSCEIIFIFLLFSPLVLILDKNDINYNNSGQIIGVFGIKKQIICNVTGGVPTPEITWRINGVSVFDGAALTTLRNSSGVSVLNNTTMTIMEMTTKSPYYLVSTLSFVPDESHVDIKIECLAENDATKLLNKEPINDLATFTVYTAPCKGEFGTGKGSE